MNNLPANISRTVSEKFSVRITHLATTYYIGTFETVELAEEALKYAYETIKGRSYIPRKRYMKSYQGNNYKERVQKIMEKVQNDVQ